MPPKRYLSSTDVPKRTVSRLTNSELVNNNCTPSSKQQPQQQQQQQQQQPSPSSTTSSNSSHHSSPQFSKSTRRPLQQPSQTHLHHPARQGTFLNARIADTKYSNNSYKVAEYRLLKYQIPK